MEKRIRMNAHWRRKGVAMIRDSSLPVVKGAVEVMVTEEMVEVENKTCVAESDAQRTKSASFKKSDDSGLLVPLQLLVVFSDHDPRDAF
ncbi:unnamed protein product [Cyprideis torosa]|uniref:Uncharacterized protein n=1 Tax=Cyprideis torosa TaxID=163714 RepID=A0A7R8ZR63_9CRUS|nr:unnamed protein product [Cyprideis torosa]CAG0902949.1 unnamed protein product [Cyprideis torosa]